MADDFLTSRQRALLAALCDTLAPSVTSDADPYGFWARTASDMGIPALVEAIVRDAPPPGTRSATLLKLLLNALANPFGAAALTGSPMAFDRLPPERREAILKRWSTSRVEPMRRSFQSLKRLTLALFYSAVDENDCNPNWPAIEYRGPLTPAPQVPKTIRVRPILADTSLDCDAVVVGSGAGGSVVAAELARAGKRVVVLEKGDYYNEADFDGLELVGYQHLYENQANLTTHDLGVVVLAGSNLGGGTTLNWTTSFRTPERVLREWELEHALPGIAGPGFEASLDAVCARLHVDTDESAINPQNHVLARGCDALGYQHAVIPRNVHGCGDCGTCGFGCPFGAKQSAQRTYLRDAAEAGAEFVVRAEARRVLIEAGRAVGVEAVVRPAGGSPPHALNVRARAVVVAAGAIHSPGLLIRSGLANPNLGRNLYLHPVGAVRGVYAEPIEMWRGVMQSVYSDEFADLDGRGYGVKLETPPAHPGLLASALAWTGGRRHKEAMQRARYNAAIIVLTRDRFGGRVSVDKTGQPAMAYRIAPSDARHLMRGMQAALRIHAAAGAQEIAAMLSGMEPFRAGRGTLEGYIDAVARRGVKTNDLALFSAHQMGTCRMSGVRSRAVVDPHGESWEVANLFLADASLFPSPSGVNPMITIMALAHRSAQYVKTRL